MWLLLAEKKIFNLRYFNILSANFFFHKNFCKIFEDITKFRENFQWNFASLQHPTFPCSLNASCPEKKRRKPNVCNFFTFCTQCIGRQHCSLKICEYWSGFTNTNTNREWAAKIQLTFWYWDEMACQWLGCFFSRIAIVFQRAVDQNALLYCKWFLLKKD